MFAGALNLISLVGTLILVPESPKYLVTKKRYDEAREAINKMAKMGYKRNIPYFFGMFEQEIKDRRSLFPMNLTQNTSMGSPLIMRRSETEKNIP